MESFASRLFKSTFLYWIVAVAASLFYFVSFDLNEFKKSKGSFAEKIVSSSKFKRLNLGIDLQGGTRLVLKVDVDSAVTNRLAEVGKSVERFFKKGNVSAEKKSFSQENNLTFDFSSSTIADKAVSIIKNNFSELEVKSDLEKVFVSLSQGDISRIKSRSVDRAVDILRGRLIDSLNVKGLAVRKYGETKVVVEIPGVDDMADIKDAITRAARLDFKIVHDSAYSKEALLNKYDGIIPSDKIMIPHRSGDEEGGRWYLVSIFPDVSGSNISDAMVSYDPHGRPAVSFKFDSEGAREMREVTRNNIGKPLGIIMDGVVTQSPVIQSEIGRDGQITGGSPKEVSRTAKLLRSGALDSVLIIESESRTGALLGKDSIAKGLFACLIALFMIFCFSILYYKLSGFFAMISLFLNMLVLLIFLAFFKATLTLPGIAGMVLTVGMAIDSSILIFEKIREELAHHVDFSRAVRSGFDGAMTVILDSNITTFLAGVVLFWYGGPVVKGFAVTLMLGVISTVIAGVFFLRSMFEFALNVLKWKNISL